MTFREILFDFSFSRQLLTDNSNFLSFYFHFIILFYIFAVQTMPMSLLGDEQGMGCTI